MIPRLRAWDIENRTFLKDNDLNFVIHPYDQTVFLAGTHCDCCDEWVWACDDEETDVIEVIRYAEFEDKNGIPIYEDYILKCHDGLHDKDFIGIVKMIDACWSIDFSHLPDGHRPFDHRIGWNREVDYLKMYHTATGNSMEIIGNIFETPELLQV